MPKQEKLWLLLLLTSFLFRESLKGFQLSILSTTLLLFSWPFFVPLPKAIKDLQILQDVVEKDAIGQVFKGQAFGSFGETTQLKFQNS